MPFQLTDVTASVQRMQIDNSAYTEFGQATPSGPLSFQGRSLLDGSLNIAQQVARPASMPRYTGSVSLPAQGTVTVNCGASSGFGVVDGDGQILSFSGDKT